VSIWPATHVSWDNVKPTEESEKGIGFVAANGSRMENYGGTQVVFEKDGKVKAMNFDVTDCKKPLASVAKIVDKGNKVASTRRKATSSTRKLARRSSWNASAALLSWLSSLKWRTKTRVFVGMHSA